MPTQRFTLFLQITDLHVLEYWPKQSSFPWNFQSKEHNSAGSLLVFEPFQLQYWDCETPYQENTTCTNKIMQLY